MAALFNPYKWVMHIGDAVTVLPLDLGKQPALALSNFSLKLEKLDRAKVGCLVQLRKSNCKIGLSDSYTYTANAYHCIGLTNH